MAECGGKLGNWRAFHRNERGNFAILTTFLAVPLMVLLVGVMDFSQRGEQKRLLQNAADAAANAALRNPLRTPRAQRTFLRKMIDINLPKNRFPNPVRSRMRFGMKRGRIVVEVRLKTRYKSLIGDFSSMKFGTLHASARASARPVDLIKRMAKSRVRR